MTRKAGIAFLLCLVPALRFRATGTSASGWDGSARCTSKRRARAPAQKAFDHAMALLHSFEFGPAMEGFNADAEGRSVVRDGALGHRHCAMDESIRRRRSGHRSRCSPGLEAITKARAAARRPSVNAPTSRRRRSCIRTAPQLINGRASWRMKRPWRRLPRHIRKIAKLNLLGAVADRLGAADRQDVRESAQGRSDPREALSRAAGPSRASRTTSFTATTCPRWPIARSRPRTATRRSRRPRRMRCTCRRIRSRASAPGRSRSTRTWRRRAAPASSTHAARNSTPWITWPMPICSRGRIKRRSRPSWTASRRSPKRSIPMPSRARRAAPAVHSRWPPSRHDGRSSTATGKRPRSLRPPPRGQPRLPTRTR